MTIRNWLDVSRLAIVAAALAVGFQRSDPPAGNKEPSPRDADLSTLRRLEDDLRRVRVELERSSPPIGSILPYVGDPSAVPDGWQLCDDKPIRDPASPLKGVLKADRVPDLTGAFLRGVSPKTEALSVGGQESQTLTHSHPVALDVVHKDHISNVNLKKEWDPGTHNAFVTNHHLFEGILGRNNGDAATGKVGGNSADASPVVSTLPPFVRTHFIIRTR